MDSRASLGKRDFCSRVSLLRGGWTDGEEDEDGDPVMGRNSAGTQKHCDHRVESEERSLSNTEAQLSINNNK